MSSRLSTLAAALAVCGCASSLEPDAGVDPVDAARREDARVSVVFDTGVSVGPADADADAGLADAAASDAWVIDSGLVDAGLVEDAGSAIDEAVCASTYRQPVATGMPAEALLTETSGIVESRSNPGVLWMHNDSGDGARLYAASPDGAALGRLNLVGLSLVDLEDIASAPCPGEVGPCLWIADTGDNERIRAGVTVYAVAEPAVDPMLPFGEQDAARIWSFPLAYPIAAVDSEALMVAPDGSTFYLFEKIDAAQAQLFRHPGPLEDGVAATLERLGSFDSPGLSVVRLGRMITAADLHPSGTRLVLRVYTGVFEYRLEPGRGPPSIRSATRLRVPITLDERQGEALAYDAPGTGLWSISEGTAQNIHFYACND